MTKAEPPTGGQKVGGVADFVNGMEGITFTEEWCEGFFKHLSDDAEAMNAFVDLAVQGCNPVFLARCAFLWTSASPLVLETDRRKLRRLKALIESALARIHKTATLIREINGDLEKYHANLGEFEKLPGDLEFYVRSLKTFASVCSQLGSKRLPGSNDYLLAVLCEYITKCTGKPRWPEFAKVMEAGYGGFGSDKDVSWEVLRKRVERLKKSDPDTCAYVTQKVSDFVQEGSFCDQEMLNQIESTVVERLTQQKPDTK